MNEQNNKKLLNKIIINFKSNTLFFQIFKFIIVGGIATVIDFIFLFLFKEIIKLPIIISNTLSFSIAVIYNYIASVKWVFNVNNTNRKKNFILFIVFSVIGLLLNDLIILILVDKFSIHYILAKIIATTFVMIFNFITRKKFLE